MSEQWEEFELLDAEGNPHQYTINKPHPPITRKSSEISGIRFIDRIQHAAGQPIAKLADANLFEIIDLVKSDMQKIDFDGIEDLGDLMDELDKLDTEKYKEVDPEFSEAHTAFSNALRSLDLDTTLFQLFRYTSRDGEALAKEHHFNSAYEQNYMELFRAAKRVVEYNGFFGSLGIGSSQKE